MKFLTSLSPNRIERQLVAMNTWKQYATEIVAVQTPENIEILAPHFPYVTFIERKIFPDKYPHKPNRVTLGELFSHGPGLLINSDCEMTGIDGWDYLPMTLVLGVRHEYKQVPGPKNSVIPCGIDAFLISPDVMTHFEEHGFILGSSVWDVWMPWHYATKGFRLERNRRQRINHQAHKSEWDEVDTDIGTKILQEKYNVSLGRVVDFVMRETGRKGSLRQ